MRLSRVAATLVSALLLLLSLDAAVAHADPSFVLSRSEARAGDSVQFSIAGAEDGATYDVEVGEREVAEGSVPAGKSVSGTFTMPDFGGTAKTVTVRAEVAEPDETTVLTRSLRFAAPVPAATGPTSAAPESAPAPASTRAAPVAPSTERAHSPGPTSRTPASKRRAGRAPRSVRERPPSTPADHQSGSPELTATTPTITTKVSDSHAIPRSAGEGKAPSTVAVRNRVQSEPRGKPWLDFATSLTAPLATSLPSSVVENSGAGWTGAVVVLALLALSALVLTAARRDEDEEVLQGTPYVPRR